MIDLGDHLIDADQYGWTIHRKVTRTRREDNTTYEATEVVGHLPTIGMVARRLTEAHARHAAQQGNDIAAAVNAAATRIEHALQGATL